ncbi:MAG TPA: hypothetical protein VE173_14030, partial [Longimicrobiales bacterium]|nr:hypothetical protein [Longimicrobiales bacterium]
MTPPRPPWLPLLAMRVLLPPEAREVIVGDLEEEFGHRVGATGGAGGARRWYRRMAFASLAAFWSPLHRVRRLRERRARSAFRPGSGPSPGRRPVGGRPGGAEA